MNEIGEKHQKIGETKAQKGVSVNSENRIFPPSPLLRRMLGKSQTFGICPRHDHDHIRFFRKTLGSDMLRWKREWGCRMSQQLEAAATGPKDPTLLREAAAIPNHRISDLYQTQSFERDLQGISCVRWVS